MTVSQGYVSVTTTSPGYKLFMSMLNDNTSLRSDNVSGVIAATSGTFSFPSALTRGTWGYAIPSGTSHIASNGFNATYTEMSSASATDTPIFATPPVASANPQLIASSASSTTGDTFPIYYAIRANSTTNPGAYSNNIAFTAVADAGTTESMTLTPSTIDPDTATTITVATTMYSTATNLDATITMTDADPTNANPTSTTLTCTKTSSTPLTYSCEVPATTAGNYTITLSSPKYDKTYTATLEVVKPGPSNFFELTTMQEMTPEICATATTPSASATHDDTTGAYAGNTDYVPTKTLVVDDRIDGTTNTKHSYTIKKLADGKCWMTENLALVGPFTPSSDDSNVKSTSEFTLTGSDTGRWCTNYNSSCMDKSMVIDTGTTYGVLYNWYAATAGTGTYSSLSSGNAESSICPKGWRLPTGGSSSELYKLHNSFYSSSAKLLKSAGGPAFVLSGGRYSSSTSSQGSQGNYWSSTADNNTNAYTLHLDNPYVYSTYSSNRFNGFSVRCVAKGPTLDDISTMQEMTPEIAVDTATGASKTLTDTRDDNTYTVRKLADGKIWMTQNLRLGKKEETITLTPDDSNVTSNWTLPNATGDTSTSGRYVYVDDTWGGYYSWVAAAAGSNPSSGNVSTSICPKGWKLPSTSGSSTDFQTLYNNYNSASNMQATDGPAFVLSGQSYGGTSEQGSSGYYWSSTAYSSSTAHLLVLNSYSVYPANEGYKDVGFSVRCVAQ